MKPAKSPFDVIGHLASLRRYASTLSRHPQDAEDLVHDALVKAYERKDTFRRGGNLRTWLMSILHNTHIDRIRRERAMGARHEAAAEIAETATDPTQADHALRLSRLREAFHALPDEQRTALHLVTIEGLSYHDAAQALDIPIGTLMSRISRGRARLRAFEGSQEGASRTGHLRIVGGKDDETR